MGPSGQWFRNEADRQKKLWKETIYPDAKTKLKADLTKRKKALAAAKSVESGGEGSRSKKRKAPLPLAFAPPEKKDKGAVEATTGSFSKEVKDDSAINGLSAKDVEPLPTWRYKRRKKEIGIEIPSMQCLASMLLADPFVMRLLLDKVQRILRADVIKGKAVPSGHPMLPSMLQLLNIARASIQLCALKGKCVSVPDAGLKNVFMDGEELSLPYHSLRNFFPLFTRLLLDAELDRRMAIGGDLHHTALRALREHPKLQTNEWKGASSLRDLLVVVECALVNLLQPGNSNESALRDQFPRFVVALNELSGRNMLNEKPFFISLANALLRYKSKLPHSTRDLVTECLIQWLRMDETASPKTAMCSALHECFMYLLNEVRR